MKFKVLLISCLSTLMLAPSCIKEEGLDREADILSVSIEDKGFVTSVVNDNTREISIIMEGDISKYENGIIVPIISTSTRATISPMSKEPVQLSAYKQTYVVTAEDGGERTYQLTIMKYSPLLQDFENWNIINANSSKPYMEPADPLWACGNSGINFVFDKKQFPTSRIEQSRPGSTGKYSVLLETTRGKRSSIDAMDIPIFSGNMYRGSFVLNATKPILSTKFGQPHPAYLGKPIALTAWYKYTPGSPYITWEEISKTKKGPDIEDDSRIDTFDMYAVLYKVSKNQAGKDFYLTGDNISKFEQDIVVAYTALENDGAKDDWFEFKAKFIHKEALNFEKYDYKLAIVLASSSEGAEYKGAVGSTLIVDDLRVVFDSDSDANEYK